MHHNTLFQDRNLKKFSGEGHSPSPLEGETPPRTQPLRRSTHRSLGFMRPVFSVPIVGNPTPIGERKYCIKHVSLFICLCVCLPGCDHIFETTCLIFTKFFVRVTYGCSSVLLWQCIDTLCTSSFMDDIIFAQKPRLLDIAAQLVQCTCSLGLGCKLCAVIPVVGKRCTGLLFGHLT